MTRFSLTARLTLFYTLASATVLLGLGGLTAWAMEQHFVDLDRAELQDKLHLIQEMGDRAKSIDEMQLRLGDVLHGHEGLSVRVQSGGTVLYTTSALAFPAIAGPELVQWSDGGRNYRGLRAEFAGPAGAPQAVQVWVALDTDHHTHFIHGFQKVLVGYVVLATLLSGLLGWGAARRGLSPLREMKRRAQAVTSSQRTERMPVAAVPVEMAELAQTLNDMLDRLQDDYRKLSEFSSDLAHELRTPISNLLTETQVTLSQSRSLATYQDVLASNSEELQSLARMVSDMLLLAKTENGLALPNPQAIAVQDEVRALFDFYEALAFEKNIALQLVGQGTMRGDRLMLRRALSNLLSNALRYASPHSTVAVELASATGVTTVGVVNQGPVIPPEMLAHLFDRFFRVDKSRTAPDSDGAGLGLAITRAIAQAHGGSIAVLSCPQETRFTLSFPKENA